MYSCISTYLVNIEIALKFSLSPRIEQHQTINKVLGKVKQHTKIQTNKKISNNNNNLTTIYILYQNYKKQKNKQTKTTAYTNQTKWKIK